MKRENETRKSIRPKIDDNFTREVGEELWVEGVGESDEEETIPEGFKGEVCERVGAPKTEEGNREENERPNTAQSARS